MAIEGLQRAQSRMSEIASRVSALRGAGMRTNATGWGPGLNGAGTGGTGSFTNAYQVALVRTQAAGTTTGLTGASTAGVTTPATVRPIGAYGRLEPPATLVSHGNGRVPADALVELGTGGHRLHAPAAHAWDTMVADAARQGVTIGLTDSYRSYDQQVELAGRKGLYAQGGWAATPGTSNHGWGMAVDVDVDDAGQEWLRRNGHRYGFVESVPREPWHWEYRPAA